MAKYLHPTSQAHKAVDVLVLQAAAAAEHLSRDSGDRLHNWPHLQQPGCILQAHSGSCHQCSRNIPCWVDGGTWRLWLPADARRRPKCVLPQPCDQLANEHVLPDAGGHRGHTVPHS